MMYNQIMNMSMDAPVKFQEEERVPPKPFDRQKDIPIQIEDDPPKPRPRPPPKYKPKDLKWKLVNVRRLPVILSEDSAGECTALMNIPRNYSKKFLPVTIKSKEIKIKIPEHESGWINPNEIHALNSVNRQITQPLVEIRSPYYPRSRFQLNIPYYFDKRQSDNVFFTLKKVNGRISMRIMRGVLHCDEWFLNEKGQMPSISGLVRFQTAIANTKSKFRLPERQDQQDLYEQAEIPEDDDFIDNSYQEQ